MVFFIFEHQIIKFFNQRFFKILINLFFDFCDEGSTVYTALNNANLYMRECGASDISAITDQYYGDSPLTKLVLDKY